ncbi:MAG: transposase, partial [Acidimicrobiaceae bacterium]|nr:transposase [Acidimicrobiaceae bacterium]
TRRSRTCPQCGNITAKNRKSQAVFACANCGYSADTDINTVRNVPHSGLVSHRETPHAKPYQAKQNVPLKGKPLELAS